MKTKIILIVALLLTFIKLEAQSFCLTPSSSSNLTLNKDYQMKVSNNNSYCLKVYFHVIRRSNGTGGQDTDSVNEAFNILNQDFNSHNISFVWDNHINYIDNDAYYGNPTTSIYNVNNHQDGIDIYLFDDSSSTGGRANGVGESSEFWVSGSYWKSPYNSLTKSRVISHEMGHVLFLWHTHHGTYDEGGNDNPCPELVNGSNSSICGDYVEDTSADPNLQFNVNQGTCQWNSSATDSNGDNYNPDEKLIMSYTDINCMQYFSPKQGERMRNSIATLQYLQQVVNNGCSIAELSSISNLCFSNNKTISITNIENITVTWQVSSNVTIVSSTNNNITLRALNANSYGDGWVKATLNNGVVVQQEFKVGVPNVDIYKVYNASLNGNYLQLNNQVWNYLDIYYDYSISGYYTYPSPFNYQWDVTATSSMILGNPSRAPRAIISPNQNQGYIQVGIKAENECGCSPWKWQLFQVIGVSGGGTGGILHPE